MELNQVAEDGCVGWVGIDNNTWLKKTKPKKDAIVSSVIDKYKERSATGIKKYGTTLADNPAQLTDWLNHLQEELMDAVLYIERTKGEI
jgi:hypothetical protein